MNRLSTGKHLTTIMMGIWLILGVFIDGFAHNHGVVETFFTPWHAILYSGYLASAIWMISLVYRRSQESGISWREAIPQGYGLGLAGVAVFFAGGIGDMIWHIIFGIEQNLTALLSPTHLILLIGALLIVTSPYRAAWHNGEVTAPGWKHFSPAFLSIVFATAAVAFFLMFAWMFRYNLPAQTSINWYWSQFFSLHVQEINEIQGLIFILLNTLLYMFPVFLLMKRWTLPFGTIALLFALLTALMGGLDGFQNVLVIPVAAVAGLLGDIVYRWLIRRDKHVLASRAVAVAAPVTLWGLYFIGMEWVDGIGWVTELWTGSIVEAALVSLALSVLAGGPEKR